MSEDSNEAPSETARDDAEAPRRTWSALRTRARAVLFDFDGVIADTEPIHFETFAGALLEFGVELPSHETCSTYTGIHDREAFHIACENAGRALSEEDCARLILRKSELFAERISEIRLLPGAQDLIEGARSTSLVTIASGGRRSDIEGVLENHGLREHFGPFISGNDIAHSKPHPQCFLLALELLRQSGAPDLLAEDCLVFEDSFRGVEGAKRAGMQCVAITSSFPADQLHQADWIVDSLEECPWSAP